MKGNKKVVELLNDVLTSELTSVNQYFLHAKMCRNWGYLRLAEINRTESIGEMKHADDLIERILEVLKCLTLFEWVSFEQSPKRAHY